MYRLSSELFLAFTFLLLVPVVTWSSPSIMNAPRPPQHHHETLSTKPLETSVTRQVFLGVLDFYRGVISPVNGARCGFSPSCSTFGRQAVKEYGPFQGVMMTADRLTRCNIFKKPDADYSLLPNGRLFDPLFRNALRDQ
jgi:putative membrane protein insertion efficiency factor